MQINQTCKKLDKRYVKLAQSCIQANNHMEKTMFSILVLVVIDVFIEKWGEKNCFNFDLQLFYEIRAYNRAKVRYLRMYNEVKIWEMKIR